ncbi:PRC-barrel domain-containing protein [Wenzhouxiangella sp. EGI_FJ10305]|uniref:PRC-barrel domain-containing protein n=1 Tax=Wenzhouxiangella sp. EGI_FJ10305 TaxID=3243768 RepID=UPI0035D590D3
MNTLTSLKCAAVLLPALALGVPMANAQDEKRDDPQDSAKTSSAFGSNPQDQRATTRAQASLDKDFFETRPARGYHSDSLIGQQVMSRSNNKSVGEISNLLLDENGHIVAVILSVGGTLGMGERDVAIAWNQIERRVDGDKTTLMVNQTEQALKDAPDYSSEVKDSRDTTYSSQDPQRAEKRQDANRPAKPATASTASDKNKSDASEIAHSQFLAAIPPRGYHSDNLIGHEVTSRSNNESIGEVSDLVLDENGQVMALVISVGGVMGLGERDVAISWDQIERSVDGDEITLTTDLNAESLKDAPKYSREDKKSRQ